MLVLPRAIKLFNKLTCYCTIPTNLKAQKMKFEIAGAREVVAIAQKGNQDKYGKR